MLGIVAQAEQAGDALSRLIDSGVLGAIAALAIIGLGIAFILLLKEKDKRIEDAGKTRDNVGEPLKRIQESIERMEAKIIISKSRSNDDGA